MGGHEVERCYQSIGVQCLPKSLIHELGCGAPFRLGDPLLRVQHHLVGDQISGAL